MRAMHAPHIPSAYYLIASPHVPLINSHTRTSCQTPRTSTTPADGGQRREGVLTWQCPRRGPSPGCLATLRLQTAPGCHCVCAPSRWPGNPPSRTPAQYSMSQASHQSTEPRVPSIRCDGTHACRNHLPFRTPLKPAAVRGRRQDHRLRLHNRAQAVADQVCLLAGSRSAPPGSSKPLHSCSPGAGHCLGEMAWRGARLLEVHDERVRNAAAHVQDLIGGVLQVPRRAPQQLDRAQLPVVLVAAQQCARAAAAAAAVRLAQLLQPAEPAPGGSRRLIRRLGAGGHPRRSGPPCS